MSAEPKRVELTPQERDRLFAALHWTGSGRPISPMTASGASSVIRRVLPAIAELIAAREAAARREALLEVRRSVAVIRTPLNNLVGLSRAQAFHVGVGEVATLLDNTLLAEPERDKEGGND